MTDEIINELANKIHELRYTRADWDTPHKYGYGGYGPWGISG